MSHTFIAKVVTLATLLMASTDVCAEQRRFYDSNGHYAGQQNTTGPNSSSFYDRSGRFSGSAIKRNDGTTSFYDKSGRFTGQVR